jgi:hypothetical protein
MDAIASPQSIPVIDINGREAAVEIGSVLLNHGGGRVWAFFVEFRQADLLHHADPNRSQIYQLDRMFELEPINALVRQPETPGEIF